MENNGPEDQQELEVQETDQPDTKRHRFDNFFLLARNAQAKRDQHAKEEQRQLDQEQKDWDETIEHIRRNQRQEIEFNH
ncbi:MAG: hypothetical protein P4L87_20625 [Formivibrio sp.]|nr:hypothetical protein [Formivibrio sp.]